MLRIRFKKVGSRKQPSFRVVVADIRESRDGSFIEDLGHYNPRTDPPTFVVDREKVDSWMSKGAQPTNSLKRMLNLGNNEELYKDVIFKHNKKSKNAAAEEPAAEVAEEPVAEVAEEPVAEVAEEPAAEVAEEPEVSEGIAKKSTKKTKSEEA